MTRTGFWVLVGALLTIVVATVIIAFVSVSKDAEKCEAAGGTLVKGICLDRSVVIHP